MTLNDARFNNSEDSWIHHVAKINNDNAAGSTIQ